MGGLGRWSGLGMLRLGRHTRGRLAHRTVRRSSCRDQRIASFERVHVLCAEQVQAEGVNGPDEQVGHAVDLAEGLPRGAVRSMGFHLPRGSGGASSVF